MRRRRIVLLLVFGMALVIVGGAMAWNRDVAGVAATGGAKLVQQADTASLSGAGGQRCERRACQEQAGGFGRRTRSGDGGCVAGLEANAAGTEGN